MNTNTKNGYIAYGTSVSNLSELIEKCSPIDSLARMIMGEARGESKNGKIACAYVVKNRQTIHRISEFGGPDYKSIVTKGNGSQFNGILSKAALKPKEVDANAWEKCLDAASHFSDERNPIGKYLWFNTNELYNSIVNRNGGKYVFGGGSPVTVVEKVVIGNHTFFRVEGYNY